MSKTKRTPIQQEDRVERVDIHQEDVSQVSEVKKALDIHAENNDKDFQLIKTQLAALLPLIEIIQPIKEIVQEKQTDLLVQKKIAKIVGFTTKCILTTGALIGSFFVIIQLIFRLKE